MNYAAAIKYNQEQADKLGWEPDWFIAGYKYFDAELVDAIVAFQKSVGVTADGYCGPDTYRRKYTERMAEIEEVKEEVGDSQDNVLIFGGEAFPINWHKVVLWTEKGGLASQEGCYRNMIGEPKRDVRFFVNHWDVCLSSTSCQNVLNQRKISVHFLVDNDGTIYQTTDLQNICWHAGGSNWNNWSIGVEISNAYYLKYQDWYVKNGYGPRPIVKGAKVNGGTLEDHLDFYDVQKAAMRAIWDCLHKHLGLPLEAPPGESTYPPAQNGDFRGFIHHYNLTDRKIDCGGWNIREELDKLKGGNS